MLKEILFHDSYENFEITRICMENRKRMGTYCILRRLVNQEGHLICFPLNQLDNDLVVPGIYQEHGNRTKIKREEMMYIKELCKHINNYEAKKLHNKSRTPVTQTLKGNQGWTLNFESTRHSGE